jgi:hypothetical protein
VAPDIEAEALVLDGSRYAAHLVVGLEHDCGMALFQEFVSRGEASGPGADDYASLHVGGCVRGLVRAGVLRHQGVYSRLLFTL